MNRWVDKVAIVTGASSGIGYATAKALVMQGMKVTALARRTDLLQQLEKEINKESHIKTMKCDVTKLEDIKAGVNWTEGNWGAINVLVNNAGTVQREKLTDGFGEFTLRTIQTNLIGYTHFIREVSKVMKKYDVQQGHIINVNSVLGHYVTKRSKVGGYTIAKHGITALSKIVYNEFSLEGRPIRVTNLSPGCVDTNIMQVELAKFHLPTLYSEDISNCINFILAAPPHVNISEMIVQPTGEILDPTIPPMSKTKK